MQFGNTKKEDKMVYIQDLFYDLLNLNNSLNDVIRDRFLGKNYQEQVRQSPLLYNVYSLNDGSYELELFVPGFKKDEIEVLHDKEDSFITVKGKKEKRDLSKAKIVNYYMDNFEQQFKVGKNIVVNNAVLEDGVLKVHLINVKNETKTKININESNNNSY